MRRHPVVVFLGLLTVLMAAGFLALAGVGYFAYQAILKQPSDSSVLESEPPLPTLVVEASYPGANANEVADAIAAPLEQAINGVEGMRRMRSQSAADGSYALTITFERGTDLQEARQIVQNRFAMAQPNLPDVCNQAGVKVRMESTAMPLIVTLSATDGDIDPTILSNIASSNLRGGLAQLPGIAQVLLIGHSDLHVRVVLHPEALKVRELTGADVVQALREQEVQFQGNGDPILLRMQGRLKDPNQVGEIVVKIGTGGRVVRLRDVAAVEVGPTKPTGFALRNQKPVIALVLPLTPDAPPRDVGTAVGTRLQELRTNLPKGLALDLAFDATSGKSDDLLIDFDLPDGASLQRTHELVRRLGVHLRALKSVGSVVALSPDPFDRGRAQSNMASIVVRLAHGDKDRDAALRSIRDLSREFPEARLRVRDVAAPGTPPSGDYAVRLAIQSENDVDLKALQEIADGLAQRLNHTPLLTDVHSHLRTTVPFLRIEVDRQKAAMMKVPVREINNLLESTLKDLPPGKPGTAEAIQKLLIRNDEGKMVPLGALVRVTAGMGPAVIHRVDQRPAAEITANLAPGTTLTEARALCEKEAKATQLRGNRLVWLSE